MFDTAAGKPYIVRALPYYDRAFSYKNNIPQREILKKGGKTQ